MSTSTARAFSFLRNSQVHVTLTNSDGATHTHNKRNTTLDPPERTQWRMERSDPAFKSHTKEQDQSRRAITRFSSRKTRHYILLLATLPEPASELVSALTHVHREQLPRHHKPFEK
jgi:hypothetical protein